MKKFILAIVIVFIGLGFMGYYGFRNVNETSESSITKVKNTNDVSKFKEDKFSVNKFEASPNKNGEKIKFESFKGVKIM